MRPILSLCLFAVSAGALALSTSPAQQPPKEAKKGQQKFDPPKSTKPDEATLKQIAQKTEQLRKAVAELKATKTDAELPDVELFLIAAERIVRHGEWLTADSGKRTLQTLDIGLARAAALAKGERPWLKVRGKWVVLGYRSQVDGSIQPYAVVFPNGYGEPQKRFRMDVILHGRDGSLTEVKFASSNEGKAAPATLDHLEMQVFGRGNNAYRWAGEADVFEALADARGRVMTPPQLDQPITSPVDPNRIVLRGFSMGGAGTWHIGLHHPSKFCVIGPGAGFTNTHGYIASLPKELPEYQEKCLHIYDAVDYAENAFDVPVVAYSGANDPQKKAADNIENALKNFKEPLRFTHLIAPGLMHQMPAEWQAKADAEYRKYSDKGRNPNPERIRFVTYTPRYGECDWITVQALEKTFERAVIDATRKENTYTISTLNVRRFLINTSDQPAKDLAIVIDGMPVKVMFPMEPHPSRVAFEKRNGTWQSINLTANADQLAKNPQKVSGLQGPIDDAFLSRFVVVGPAAAGWVPATEKYITTGQSQFAHLWDKYFHGTLPGIATDKLDGKTNLILFGDPQSNPLIAKALPQLPITWTKDELVVNGVKYDAKSHVPVLIYPNPLSGNQGYLVLNSGHTFREADLKGTNALLYPRLGDWAVIKPTPTEKDPAAHEVVAAGLFDENWQFPKK